MAAVSAGSEPGTAVLHCIYDPLCGWCYAAAPLLAAAAQVEGLAIALHGGGMLAGPARTAITPQWRDHVMPHDRRIAQMTGQPFGTAYFDGLLRRIGTVLDSEPPIAAILAAQAAAGRGLDMLHALQRAHYVEGLVIAEPAVQLAAAQALGLGGPAFEQALARVQGEPTRSHIAASRQRMADAGGQGFPTFALALPGEHGGAPLRSVDAAAYLGRPQAWQQAVRTGAA